jgi:hypothetical protein
MAKTMDKQYTFNGKSLMAVPEAGFLTDEAALEEYNGIVEKDFCNNDALRVLKYDRSGKVVTGSNPFAVTLMNRVVGETGLRVATAADLQLMINGGNEDTLRGHYEDTALGLRSIGEPNIYLSRDLTEQIKERTGNDLDGTVVIPYTLLTLETDSESPNGLRFVLQEGAEQHLIYPGNVLNTDGRFNNRGADVATGLPTQTSDTGERQLWTRNSGLSGLFLNNNLDLDANDGNLASSGSGGRVVVVKEGAAGVAPEMPDYVARLDAEKKQQTAELDRKFQDAMRVLKGK